MTALDEPRAMLTVREAADRLGVRQATVRAWVRDGRLAAWREGRVIRLAATALAPERQDEAAARVATLAEGLDAGPAPAHTPGVLGEANQPVPLYRVYMTRRRGRAGGPWVLRWRDPPAAGPMRQTTIGRMSERLAERHRELWQAELNGVSAGADEARGMRWSAFVAAYLDSVSALAPATVRLYRQALARLERTLGPRWLSDVDRLAAERYRAERGREVAPETVAKDLRHLGAAWSWAIEQGLAEANPFTSRRGRGRRERHDPDALAAGDTDRFLAAIEARPTWVWASLRLAALWGPRTGELAEALREDVEPGALRIPARSGRRTPKGGRGRVVPVDETTGGLLQELSHRSERLLWAPEHRSTDQYRQALVREANAILAALGLSERRHPIQMLRRTAETNLRRRGVPDWMIGRILGHGTRVGEQYYAGLGPEEIAGQVLALVSRPERRVL